MKQILIINLLMVSGTIFTSESANNEEKLIVWHIVSHGMHERSIIDGSIGQWGLINSKKFCEPALDESGNKFEKWKSPNHEKNEQYLKPRENNDERCKSPTNLESKNLERQAVE